MEPGKKQRNPRDYYYGEILQLPPGTTAPDHYVLLGVRYFEEEHDAILRSAMERIRLLEACEADPRPAYRKVVRQLVAEVRDAQLTLLDPRRRKVYDATLTGAKEEAKAAEEDKELELPPGTMYAERYRIMREVRHGALGIVYEAMDKNLRSKVHLSVLRPKISFERRPRRVIEQAALAAVGLHHHHILAFDEVGAADGLLFVRTRAVEGKSLLEVIEATKQMRLDPDEARRIVLEIAEALKYAHEQGAVHGDLRPHNVFLDEGGRVLVGDFCVSRAVADVSKDSSSRYREPENDPTPAGDLFGLGCLAYQMLAGMPPFPDVAARTPRPLPADVPDDLGGLVVQLLAREPEQRPAGAAEVLERLSSERKSKRVPILAALGAVLVVAVGAALFGGGDEEKAPATVQALAWRLIAESKFDDAIKKLREARHADPADVSLVPPLAKALVGAARGRERAGDPWKAQVLLEEAVQLESTAERVETLAQVKKDVVRKLQAIAVEVPAVTAEPAATVRADGVPLRSAVFDGKSVKVGRELLVVPFDRAEGAHEIGYTLVDKAGNQREGAVRFIVDRTAPVLEIVEPDDGAQFRRGGIPVRVRVTDENPAASVAIGGRDVPLTDGEARTSLEFDDGEHEIPVVARDRAGHEVNALVNIVVDSRAPDMEVAATRFATRDGKVTIRGKVVSRVKSVSVDGRPVELDEDGAFEAYVVANRDRTVRVTALGLTGLERRVDIKIIVDDAAPTLSVNWARRNAKGTLLYGTKEMDAGALLLPLTVEDKTAVTFLPEHGVVEKGVWKLPPRQGARKVKLGAIDEAGNETELVLELEGRRATPRLEVKCTTKPDTNDKDTALEIDADEPVLVQGKPTEPGRVKIKLEEGRVELTVRAVDAYGNEARWTKVLRVDRTPPKLRLEGKRERGIGKQELVFVANEDLKSITCFGKTVQAKGAMARIEADLKQGRRRIHVVVKDLAGNSARQTFDIEVKNRVLVLDGRSAVQVKLPATVLQAPCTVECWVRGTQPMGSRTVLSNYGNSGVSFMWSSSKSQMPYAVFYGDRSGRHALQVKKAWKWENWTHLAFSNDGKRCRFYVNGSLQQTVELREPIRASKEAFYIGRSPGRTASYFLGAIDEVRVSNVARYTRGFTPPRFHREDEHTVLLLRFDNQLGKFFPDSSGKGHRGLVLGNAKLREENR